MGDLAPMLLMLGLAGAAITFVGAAARWFMAEERRMRRSFKLVLGVQPDAMIVAHGTGRGAGFAFGHGRMATAWDGGAWCLVWRLDEMLGGELQIDGAIAARSVRDEPRRPLDQAGGAGDHVVLRLLFDDPHQPEFDLVLWRAGDDHPAGDAVREGARWIGRLEAMMRRLPSRRPAPRPQADARPPERPPAAQTADDPPWDEDDDR